MIPPIAYQGKPLGIVGERRLDACGFFITPGVSFPLAGSISVVSTAGGWVLSGTAPGGCFMRTFIFLVIGLIPSCDQQPVKNVPKAILSVTWLVPGQSPQTTTTPMTDIALCVRARIKAVLAGEEARNERTRLNEQDKAEASASLQKARAGGGLISGLTTLCSLSQVISEASLCQAAAS
jgi:hypothetical protein